VESTQQTSDGALRAARVWNAMKALYGAGAFTAAYGDEPNHIWLASIEHLTDRECRDGLTRLAKEARSYPANLTEFMEACKPKSPGVRFLGVPERKKTSEQIALESKRATKEVTERYMASMKKLLGPAPKRKEELRTRETKPRQSTVAGCTCPINDIGRCPVCQAYGKAIAGDVTARLPREA